MLPDINSSKTPLDTSIVFSTKTYNYYNIKCKGFARLRAQSKISRNTAESALQPYSETVKLKEIDLPGSPHKVSSEPFILDTEKIKPRSNTVCIRSGKIKSNPQLLPFNLTSQKKSLPRLQSPEKPKPTKTRKCCNKEGLKHQNTKDLTTILEQKLFKEIKDDDTAERLQMMKLRGKDKLANYTSSGLQEQEKWGTAGKQVTRGFSTFGRNIQRSKKQDTIQGYSREELQRLVLSDVKLYIPSRAQYVRDYTKEIIRELILQSNTGVKYRDPCS